MTVFQKIVWSGVVVAGIAVFYILGATVVGRYAEPPPPITPVLQKIETSTEATTTPACVQNGREDLPCYEAYYTDRVKKIGVTESFVDLKARYASSSAVRSECHQITHAIGHASAELGSGVGVAFAIGDPFCWSGYYHGVMEGIVKEVGTEALASKINDICTDIPGKATYSFEYYNCVHGLGHGVMELYDANLFTSLDACSKLKGEWEQSSCGGGVFMENIMIESRGGVSAYLKKDDPLYPCDAVSELHKSQCYLMQTSHMLTAAGDDFGKVFTQCAAAEESYRGTCYQSLGRDASGRSVSDAVKTKAICMMGSTPFAQENCVIGAVKDFVSFFHSDTQANAFCTSLNADLKHTCLQVAQSYYSTF